MSEIEGVYTVAAMREEMLPLQEKTAKVLLERNPVDKIAVLLDTVRKLAENIAEAPEDPQYRRLEKAQAVLQERVLKRRGGEHFLLVCGWEETADDVALVFPPHCDLEAFTQGVKVLDEAVGAALEGVAEQAAAAFAAQTKALEDAAAEEEAKEEQSGAAPCDVAA
eukprot:TRINITY_DN24557_c0_g1_i1.p3 TRINITY_DN24557_c0_g1~~TRINITY_DN24557_c0_g1_i1.p3  ORF type:complete len:166 (+),score=88.73 TRINITY_DN24557_c0_g1_i1:67-564(+)